MLEALLQLQGHDTTADQLRHRRENLPQRATLVELRAAASAQEVAVADLTNRRDELARSQRRLEDEVAAIEAKTVEEEKRMYAGSITSPRELQALQQEIESLERRQRRLEDEVLTLMEQIEPLDEEIVKVTAARADLDTQIAATVTELDEVEQAIAADLASVEAEIAQEREPIDPAVLERYDTMRRQLGGIAIARLVGNTCGGCHLSLSAVELDRIRHEPPGALVTCEECGRLLVR